MDKQIKKKVVVYAVQNNQLLVFRHIDFSYEEVGLQVPVGSVEGNESLEVAALRELTETVLKAFEIVAYLGSSNYDISPHRNEIQERYFYLAKTTGEVPERCFSQEDHDGIGEPTYNARSAW